MYEETGYEHEGGRGDKVKGGRREEGEWEDVWEEEEEVLELELELALESQEEEGNKSFGGSRNIDREGLGEGFGVRE